MATYNIFPKTPQDIIDLKLDAKKTAQLIDAFSYTRANMPTVETPFALSKDNSYRTVKVMRYVCSSMDIKELKKRAQLFTFTPGDGTRTKKGVASKGIGFEKDVTDSFNMYIEQGADAVVNGYIKNLIKDLVSQYSLDKSKTLSVRAEGRTNKKRGIMFQGDQPIIGTSASDFNIGSKVSDVTILGNEEIYLSLKYDNFAFFNTGIVTLIPESEMKQGFVQNTQGQSLLNLFGIDNVKFCQVFKHYKDSNFKQPVFIDNNPNYDAAKLKKFVMSGIGYGYHMVHKHKSGQIENYKVTRQVTDSQSNIRSVKIRYPFVSAKVVYVYVTTDVYKLTIMFRNNQSMIYPNVIQGYAELL